MKAASISDYRTLARRRLPGFLFEYLDGGSYAEDTLRRNVEDIRAISLRQRVLRDVSQIDPSITLWGERLELPVVLGPIGLAGMNSRRGEVQAARAAESAGVPFCLSTVSACSLEEVVHAVQKPIWFQLYVMRDREFMRELLARVRASLCPVLVVTVDMPVPGVRYRDYHSGLAGAAGFGGTARRCWQGMTHARWAWDVGLMGRPHSLGNVAPSLGSRSGLKDFLDWMRNSFDPTVTWSDLEKLRADWAGKLVIKGILDEEDAQHALAIGADGIIVSNHGGRQLDGVPSTTRALPKIRDIVQNQGVVLVDGGIRSGVDVARMLALGAHGVVLGRAWAYGLAARGEAGVVHVLQMIKAELHAAMALTGVTNATCFSRDAIAVVD